MGHLESDGELLGRLGTDGMKWAEEFLKRAREDGTVAPNIDDSWVFGWFANAIETGIAAGRRQVEGPFLSPRYKAVRALLETMEAYPQADCIYVRVSDKEAWSVPADGLVTVDAETGKVTPIEPPQTPISIHAARERRITRLRRQDWDADTYITLAFKDDGHLPTWVAFGVHGVLQQNILLICLGDLNDQVWYPYEPAPAKE